MTDTRTADEVEALRASEERLRLALEAAGVGSWELDLRSNTAPVRSLQHDRIFGYAEPLAEWSYERFLEHVHPDDRADVDGRFRVALATGGAWDFECRIIRADGEGRWIWARGGIYHDEDGTPARALGIVSDITTRKRAERALREAEERYRLVARAANDVIWDWSPGSGEVVWSEGLERVFGYPPDAPGTTIEEAMAWWGGHIHPDDRDRVVSHFREAVERGNDVWTEAYRFRRADGSYASVADQGYIGRDETGTPERMVGSMRDVTDRESAESLREHLMALLERTSDLVGFADAEGRTLYLNPAGRRLLGMPARGDLSATRIVSYVAPDEREGFLDRALRPALEKGIWRGSVTLWHRDGRPIPTSQVILVHRSASGDVEFVSTIVRDMTEEKRTEAILRGSEQRYRALVEASAQIVWVTNAAGEFDTEQPDWHLYTGQSRSEYQGGGGFDAIHPDDREQTMAAWQTAVAKRAGLELRYRLRRHDGEYRWMQVRAVPVLNDDGSVREWVGTNTDVTERRRARAELELAREQAEQANQAKSQFLATMSHELRTPLNAILGYTDLLTTEVGGPLTHAQRQQMGRIEVATRHLIHLIEEVLRFARIDAGKEELAVEEFDLAALVRDTAALLEPLARGKGLRYDVDAPIEAHVESDPAKIRQILLNLLSNAVKFTEAGEVAVELSAAEDSVGISVNDSGVGIPPEQLDRIFEPFHQAGRSITQPLGGTGLGLAVSRELARLLGGELTVSSAQGKGSTFTVRLPRRRADGGTAQP